jgi:hypothetical protein
MGAGALELSPGGGGGFDHPFRPTENYDDEEPNHRARALAAVQRLHEQRYGEGGHRGYMGTSPEDLKEMVRQRHTGKGSIAIRGAEISTSDQTNN